jgi:AraC-like DNA-binding protein
MGQQMVSPGFIDDALACVRRQGMPTEPVLQAAALSSGVRQSITAQQYGQLWLAIAEAMDDEFFGLFARPARCGSFALLGHAVLHAGTLETALRRALRYLRIVLDEPYGELIVANGQAQITLTSAVPRFPAFAFRTFWLILLGLSCWLIGRRIPLQRIDFACVRPSERTDYDQFFGIPVHFDQPKCRLIFSASYLDLPTIRSERALKTFLRGAPGNLLVRYRHDAGWVAKIQEHLKRVPAAEWPDFDTLATRLNVSPATLRRRLRSEGQSFSAVKEEMRGLLAQTLLRESTLGVAEIAYELGFTEPSAFHRAFRKWTGTSPGSFRRDSRERVRK